MAIPVGVLLAQAARLGIGAAARKWSKKKLIREIAKKTSKQKDQAAKTNTGRGAKRRFKPKTGKGNAKRNVPTDLSIKD